MNCERMDPPKLLWEWELIFPTCTHPTFSNHCNWWLCNQSRDFFCDTTLVFTVTFPCKGRSDNQGTRWTLQEKLLPSPEVSGAVQRTSLQGTAVRLGSPFIKGNLCGLLKQTDIIPLINFISIQGFCSFVFILYFYSPLSHVNLKYF